MQSSGTSRKCVYLYSTNELLVSCKANSFHVSRGHIMHPSPIPTSTRLGHCMPPVNLLRVGMHRWAAFPSAISRMPSLWHQLSGPHHAAWHLSIMSIQWVLSTILIIWTLSNPAVGVSPLRGVGDVESLPLFPLPSLPMR